MVEQKSAATATLAARASHSSGKRSVKRADQRIHHDGQHQAAGDG